jgi:glucan phosphorylase
MEYILSEALPIYSGGLGNVAGDQLKAASDLGVPVVAVGLLYQQGYFRQEFDAHGNQQARHRALSRGAQRARRGAGSARLPAPRRGVEGRRGRRAEPAAIPRRR